MKLFFYIIFSITLLVFNGNFVYAEESPLPLLNNKVSDVHKRKKLISLLTTHIRKADKDRLLALTAYGDPFHEKLKKNKVIDIDANQKNKKSVQVLNVDASPEQILKAVGNNIKPSGSMLRGGEAYLLFGKHLVGVGETLVAKYNNNSYSIYVENIEENSYTLRLGDKKLLFEYLTF